MTSILNRNNLKQPIQMQISKKKKCVSEFSSPFLELKLYFEHLKKKDGRHAYIFRKLQTAKNLVR